MADIYVATTGNDTTGDGSIGNPYASPGKAAGVAAAGDTVWVKSGTYNVSSTTPNASNGPVQHTSYLGNARLTYRGYQTTVGDDGTPPVLRATVAGISNAVVYINDAAVTVWNIRCDANGQSSLRGLDVRSRGVAVKCSSENGTSSLVVGGYALGCVAKDNTTDGFTTTGAGRVDRCIATGNSGVGFSQSGATPGTTYTGCVAHDNGSHGFSVQVEDTLVNCIAYGSGGYGFVSGGGGGDTRAGLFNCASGANTSGRSSGPFADVSAVTLSADPFVNAAGYDFGLNTTSGGGAACRAAGVPGVFPAVSTTGYPDIGAAQHQDAGGGASGTPAFACVG